MATELDIPCHYFAEGLVTDKVPDDFTFYVDPETLDKTSDLGSIVTKLRSEAGKTSLNKKSFQGEIKFAFDKQPVTGRALICLAYRNRLVSVTFRLRSGPGSGLKNPRPKTQVPEISSWMTLFTPDRERGNFLNSIGELCDEIKTAVLSKSDPAGLVVITGATASGKSKITRGLIDLHLCELVAKGIRRRPHLITYEDPIESFFMDSGIDSKKQSPNPFNIPSHKFHIDYTPREHGADVPDLRSGLNDALRQTPKVFLVGETRDHNDWKELLDFARSGHLVVTTAHAGSMVEAMQLLFEGTSASTPAKRNLIAGSILGVVHLAKLPFFAPDPEILLPSIWRPTPKGVNDLTALGMSALLPGDSENSATLGRKYMAARLIELAKKDSSFTSFTLDPKLEPRIMAHAMEMDLRGL